MKKIILGLMALAAVACSSNKTSKEEYIDWLYSSMPLPDSLTYPRSYWEENVAKTLEVREKMGWDVPEREFRHFVLPLRVNNETLDDFRTVYADTLCARVKGMSMYEAALEINHWCHEQATYAPSDARTSAPMATVRRGLGRCGEESVLAVAALRAAGIPARQVYTPRWAHTDDNHAWVEVFVDGKWWFMGACEPEARLNMAWFNAPVSRAMLLHTKVYGDYKGDEDVIYRTYAYTEINVINGYVPARRTVVTVKDTDGNPVEGALVDFCIYNYAEFYPVASYATDGEGKAALNTGLGDVFIWAYKDGRFGFGKVSSESAEIALDHNLGEEFSMDLEVVPPVEDPIPAGATQEELARNVIRLAEEDAIRASHDHSNPAVEQFRMRRERGVNELLDYLSPKDLTDVSAEVLEDVMQTATSLDPYVLCPRVDIEALRPHRVEILSSGIGERLTSPSQVVQWVRDSIEFVPDRNPQNLRIPPISVWRSRKADLKGRRVFFVALCRTLGFPARIDEVTGKTQYRENGEWKDVDFEVSAPAEGVVSAKGRLGIPYSPSAGINTPCYYRHFTISRIDGDGVMHLQEFGTDADQTSLTSLGRSIPMDEGYYMLTSGTRLSNGNVLAHVEFFNIREGSCKIVPLTLRQTDDALSVIGSMDAEQTFLRDGESEPQTLLSATGRGIFVLACMGSLDEPTSHARAEFAAAASDLARWGRPLVMLRGDGKMIDGLDAIYGTDIDGALQRMLTEGCELGRGTLPVIAVCDTFGHVFYVSQGYNTSLASDLRRVITLLSR